MCVFIENFIDYQVKKSIGVTGYLTRTSCACVSVLAPGHPRVFGLWTSCVTDLTPQSVSNLSETFGTPSAVFFFWSFFVQRAKMSRIDAERLDAMSKKELVDLIQSVAPLDMLQSNSLGGNPANVAKKANKERIVDCRSRASDALTSTH